MSSWGLWLFRWEGGLTNWILLVRKKSSQMSSWVLLRTLWGLSSPRVRPRPRPAGKSNEAWGRKWGQNCCPLASPEASWGLRPPSLPRVGSKLASWTVWPCRLHFDLKTHGLQDCRTLSYLPFLFFFYFYTILETSSRRPQDPRAFWLYIVEGLSNTRPIFGGFSSISILIWNQMNLYWCHIRGLT